MSTVQVSHPSPSVAVITLDRPDRLNAIDFEMVADLHDALDAVGNDRSCNVAILTGAGRGFCAGLDLKDYGTPPEPGGHRHFHSGMDAQAFMSNLTVHMRDTPQVIIAAVNGAASGGGLALTLASDIRIAAASARFNVAFVRIGLSGCDIGVSWLLPRLIGASRAYELMLTGRFLPAAEAKEIGLVLDVVPDGQVVDAALKEAELIIANSPFGVQMTKEVMWSQLEIGSLAAGIDLENRTQLLASHTGDMVEAVAAFMEKRPPRYGDQ